MHACVNVFRDIRPVFMYKKYTGDEVPPTPSLKAKTTSQNLDSISESLNGLLFHWYSHLKKGYFCSGIPDWFPEMPLNVKWVGAHVLLTVDQ